MKPSKRQANALKKSIKKWEAIVDGTEADNGSDNCELCQKYVAADFNNIKNDCKSCPVFLTVGVKYCRDTPYPEWAKYIFMKSSKGKVFDAESKRLAQAELDFLRGILEEST